MDIAAQMIETSRAGTGFDASSLSSCIGACVECAQACTACADACLAEPMVAELLRSVTTNSNCADVCEATGRVLSRQTEYEATLTRAVLEACRVACRQCAEECERHADMHEHCRI